MMKKNGFIATSIMYSFFIVFSMLCLLTLGTYTHYRVLNNNLNNNIKIEITNKINDEIPDYDPYESPFKDASGANGPQLFNGLIPITFNSSGQAVVASASSNWYDYDNHKWANAVLVGTSSPKTAGQILNQDEILQYYVWIPRFRYKLFNANINEKCDEQMIEIEFEKRNVEKSDGDSNGEWLTHPAFTFGNTELSGFWVGKFETTGAVTTSSLSRALTIKPLETSLRNISLSNAFKAVRELDTTYGSQYGLVSSQIDTHIMRNFEWGAVAYLSSSKYGLYENATTCIKTDCEVLFNSNNKNQTGCAAFNTEARSGNVAVCQYEWTNTYQGIVGSTTHNITGVYDMAGGAWDMVMGNMETSSHTFNKANSGFTGTLDDKYYDELYDTDTWGRYDDRGKLGDATREVHDTNLASFGGWFWDQNDFPYQSSSTYNYPWFVRGGDYKNQNAGAGLYAYQQYDGSAREDTTFRIVLSAQDGNYNGNGY